METISNPISVAGFRRNADGGWRIFGRYPHGDAYVPPGVPVTLQKNLADTDAVHAFFDANPTMVADISTVAGQVTRVDFH